MSPLSLVLFGVDVIGTLIGIYAMRSRAVSGRFKAISAGIMVGAALFWIFPDLMQKSGTVHAALIVGVGLAALCGIDRFVYPICPCCAGEHDHSEGGHSLGNVHERGPTLIPLLVAICVHNLFDGWTAAVAGYAGGSTSSGIGMGLIAHKIPEALVFGLMIRGATNRSNIAVLNACLTSIAILLGGAAHWSLGALSETTLLATSLALACSSFLFVGTHFFLRQQRCEGTRSAFSALLIGFVTAALVEQAMAAVLAP